MAIYRLKKIPTSSFLIYYSNVTILLRKELILMPTPVKPYSVLKSEGKSHRTIAELEKRKKEEQSLSTGTALRERPEVKDNPVAHKEFLRINKLLKSIEKNDAIYEVVINRYCMLQAECFDLVKKRERLYEIVIKLDSAFDAEIDKTPDEEKGKVIKQYSKSYNDTIKSLISIDSQVQTKRKMLLDIEKENIMTIAAALRSIPKKVDESEDPLLKVLRGG
jgi:vacuolar-type H+-ATPase subunit I/STV1